MLESLAFLDEMVGYMNALGWDVHSFDHEDGNGQYEFDFSYTDAVAMADRFMLFRMMAKEVARSHGYEATFMAKPWSDRTGGGAHFNMSLAAAGDDGANLFAPGEARGRTAGTVASRSSATASWPGCSSTRRRSWPSPARQ